MDNSFCYPYLSIGQMFISLLCSCLDGGRRNRVRYETDPPLSVQNSTQIGLSPELNTQDDKIGKEN